MSIDTYRSNLYDFSKTLETYAGNTSNYHLIYYENGNRIACLDNGWRSNFKLFFSSLYGFKELKGEEIHLKADAVFKNLITNFENEFTKISREYINLPPLGKREQFQQQALEENMKKCVEVSTKVREITMRALGKLSKGTADKSAEKLDNMRELLDNMQKQISETFSFDITIETIENKEDAIQIIINTQDLPQGAERSKYLRHISLGCAFIEQYNKGRDKYELSNKKKNSLDFIKQDFILQGEKLINKRKETIESLKIQIKENITKSRAVKDKLNKLNEQEGRLEGTRKTLQEKLDTSTPPPRDKMGMTDQNRQQLKESNKKLQEELGALTSVRSKYEKHQKNIKKDLEKFASNMRNQDLTTLSKQLSLRLNILQSKPQSQKNKKLIRSIEKEQIKLKSQLKKYPDPKTIKEKEELLRQFIKKHQFGTMNMTSEVFNQLSRTKKQDIEKRLRQAITQSNKEEGSELTMILNDWDHQVEELQKHIQHKDRMQEDRVRVHQKNEEAQTQLLFLKRELQDIPNQIAEKEEALSENKEVLEADSKIKEQVMTYYQTQSSLLKQNQKLEKVRSEKENWRSRKNSLDKKLEGLNEKFDPEEMASLEPVLKQIKSVKL